MSIYPDNWPRCPVCDDPALDGHITCGRWECDEADMRRKRAEEFRAHDARYAMKNVP